MYKPGRHTCRNHFKSFPLHHNSGMIHIICWMTNSDATLLFQSSCFLGVPNESCGLSFTNSATYVYLQSQAFRGWELHQMISVSMYNMKPSFLQDATFIIQMLPGSDALGSKE